MTEELKRLLLQTRSNESDLLDEFPTWYVEDEEELTYLDLEKSPLNDKEHKQMYSRVMSEFEERLTSAFKFGGAWSKADKEDKE